MLRQPAGQPAGQPALTDLLMQPAGQPAGPHALTNLLRQPAGQLAGQPAGQPAKAIRGLPRPDSLFQNRPLVNSERENVRDTFFRIYYLENDGVTAVYL